MYAGGLMRARAEGTSRRLVAQGGGFAPPATYGLLPPGDARWAPPGESTDAADSDEPYDYEEDLKQAAAPTARVAYKKSELKKMVPEQLSPDSYSLALAIFVRDVYWCQKYPLNWASAFRVMRVFVVMLLVTVTWCFQLWIVLIVKYYVTTMNSHQARSNYHAFERHMYEGHMKSYPGDWSRGKNGHFRASLFQTLPTDVKEVVCYLPHAIPLLAFPVLFIWTLLVLADIQKAYTLYKRLILTTPTIDNMRDSLVFTHRVCTDDFHALLTGLTTVMKVLISALIIVPRILVDAALVYLGCHWLMGTTNHLKLIVNAVALGTVLLIKDLMWTVVPHRLQLETINLYIMPGKKKSRPQLSIYMDMFGSSVVAAIWVTLYITVFQVTIPWYQWDLAKVCAKFLENHITNMAD